MLDLFKYAAVVAVVAGAALAQTAPGGGNENGNGTVERPCKENCPPDEPSIECTATCERPNGCGLMAFSDDTSLLDLIKARLAAGETVMVDVAGTDVLGISPSGQMRVLGVVDGPGGRQVVCYRSY
jgi:hypothetical protein